MLSTIRIGYVLSLLITPFADVFGRRRLLLYTIFGYTIFTGLSAIAPSAASFAACQIVARAFAGAEATIALVILTEEVDAGVRGWAIGYLGALSSRWLRISGGSLRVGQRDSLRMARAVRHFADPADRDHSAAPRVTRKSALRARETRRRAAHQHLPTAALIVQVASGAALDDGRGRLPRQFGRQFVGRFSSQVSAGGASLVTRPGLDVVHFRRRAGNPGQYRRRAAQRSLRPSHDGRALHDARRDARLLDLHGARQLRDRRMDPASFSSIPRRARS